MRVGQGTLGPISALPRRPGCTDSCKRPSPFQAHCGACHVTFGGVGTFDRHRFNGTCRDPADLGFVERDRIWRQPGGDALGEVFDA